MASSLEYHASCLKNRFKWDQVIPEAHQLKKRSLNAGIYGKNSNLDQISDWLTKILVAIGLTQITRILEALGWYLEIVKPAFGGFKAVICLVLQY